MDKEKSRQENYNEIIKKYKELNDSLKETVKIDHNEVLKIVVKDLIKKRNSINNKSIGAFDKVLLYYLGDEDFEKYVLNSEKMEE